VPSRALTPAVRSGLFDLLVVAGVAGLTGSGISDRITRPATTAIGFGMAVALAFRRGWPLAVMATSPPVETVPGAAVPVGPMTLIAPEPAAEVVG
jgi:hypothetical protein